ncbi:restriction endonuclease subunit S [Mycoplasmoides gallisepticum]|uniref:restriction endonuclease subunit S n=1 Tax=Mycoplasmoides gallisepticum TaxID=2096 RepID=UPI0039176DA2
MLAVNKTTEEKTNKNRYPVYSSQTLNNGLLGYYHEYLYEDTITWTTDGNAGTVNFRSGKFYCTNVCGVLLSKKVKADKMIAEALNNVAKSYVSYAGNPKLMNNVMAGVEIMIPTNEEEREKISNIFATLDHLITLNQLKLEKLKNIKQSLLEKMLPKNNADKPQIRFKGHTYAWKQVKLKTLADFLRGNGLNWDAISQNGKQDCILYGHLYTDYGMIIDKVLYRTNEKLKNPFFSKFGDVLIPGSGHTPNGLARATSIEKDDVLIGGDVNIIRPRKSINGSYLSLCLNSCRNKLIQIIKGSIVRHIHNSDIKEIKVHVSIHEKEQALLVSIFKNIDNLLALHQRKCEKLQNIKEAILEKMFC